MHDGWYWDGGLRVAICGTLILRIIVAAVGDWKKWKEAQK